MRRWHSFMGLAVCSALALLAQPCSRAVADGVTSRSVLADALAAANQIDDDSLKAQTLDLIATAQAQTGDAAGAKQTADAIVVNTAGDSAGADTEAGWKRDAYAAIAGGQAGSGDIAGARATVASIDDAETRDLAYQYIAQALARKGEISGAKRFAAHASGTYQTRADVTIAVAEANAGRVDDAMAIATSMDDAYQQVQALALIAQAQAKAGDATGARHTIELAKVAAGTVYDYLASTTYGAIATALVKAGDLDGANALRKIDDQCITREIAIAQADAGDINGARATLEQISDPYGLACANSSLAVALVKAGNALGASQAFDAARSAASSVTESSDAADACGRVASVQAKFGNPNSAADWARSQQDPFVKVSALVSVARALPSPKVSSPP
jgi:hypothetical protein